MKSAGQITVSKGQDYLKLIFWAILIPLAGKFILKDAVPYFSFDDEVFGRWKEVKWSLIGHITGGMLALIIGPFQFWTAFRDQYRPIHRVTGRIYLTGILIATISSTYLAWTTAVQVHLSWAIALQGLGFAWILTAGMAFIQILRGRVTQHKEWMIRSYVVTFGFVTFRFLNDMESIQSLGNFVERGPTEVWLAWAIPLLISEVFISWNKK